MGVNLPEHHKNTIGADRNEDSHGFVAEMQRDRVAPLVVQNSGRSRCCSTDGRPYRQEGAAQSIRAPRGITKIVGWMEQLGGLRQRNGRAQINVTVRSGQHLIVYKPARPGHLLWTWGGAGMNRLVSRDGNPQGRSAQDPIQRGLTSLQP